MEFSVYGYDIFVDNYENIVCMLKLIDCELWLLNHRINLIYHFVVRKPMLLSFEGGKANSPPDSYRAWRPAS